MKKEHAFGTFGNVIAVIVLALALARPVAAGTYYVATTGSDVPGVLGDPGNPWRSITNAVARVGTNDTILVGGGIYTQQVSLAGRSLITLRGGYDASWNWDPANQATTIRTTNGISPIVIPAGAVSNTFSYLTLRGGTNSTPEAGIKFTGVATNTFVEGCMIVSNYYGIYSGSFRPQNIELRNTLVARNNADGLYFALNGIGAGVVGGTGLFYNCTFADNVGNGIRTSQGGPDHGDLVPRVINSIFTGNSGYGIYKLGNAGAGGSVVSNCLFYGNRAGAIESYASLALGGNKTRYPKYVNAAINDYRLQATSPAAAAGLDLSGSPYFVTNDILNATRPNGTCDMGAYEAGDAGEGALVSEAHVKTVADGGSDTTGDGTIGLPWATINYALGQVANGGIVRVAGGTYAEQVGFGPDKQRITIQGGFDPATWNWDPSNRVTTINGSGYSPIQIGPGANSNALRCLMLRGGTATDDAGIEFSGYAPYFFADGCTITGNYHGVYGNYGVSATPTFKNCVITRNSQYGIYFYLRGVGVATTCGVFNCTIAYNGNYGYRCDGNPDWGVEIVPIAKNSIFCGNTGYGIYKATSAAGASIQNCFFYGNTVGDTYDPGYSRLTNLGGNKSGRDPKFVNITNDFRLQAGSPALAAGTDLSGASYGVTNDIQGATRPAGVWDMGAYESGNAGESALPALVHVATNGSDTTGAGSAASPWATIGYALGNVATGGTVRVAGGVYAERTRFGVEKTGITVQGAYTNNAGVWTLDLSNQVTTIDGTGNSPLVFEVGANSNTVANMNIRGGTASGHAGILMNGTVAGLYIDGCTMISNRYGFYSGTEYRQQNVTFRNSIIARSISEGIYFYLNAGTTRTSMGTSFAYNCTIAYNGGTGFKGGVTSDRDHISPVAINCIFSGNGGFGVQKLGNGNSGGIRDCLFHGNTLGDYQSLSGGFTTLSDIVSGQDPKYVGAVSNDYRLQADSPAADVGTNLVAALGVTTDILGATRPLGADYDMGAYERAGAGPVVLLPAAYVRTNGNDTTGNGTTNAPWATVGYALGQTVSSGTVYVAGGVYAESLSFGVNKLGATVRGGYNPTTWAWEPASQASVIDGGGNSPVKLAAGSHSNLLSYLTLRGGTNAAKAGIEFLGVASNLVVEGCTIVSNTYGLYSPAAVWFTVRNTVIARNASHAVYPQSSGGDYSQKGDACFYNCTVADNGGHGFYCQVNDDWASVVPKAYNSIFAGNNGYGIWRRGSFGAGVASNCLFYGNTNGPVRGNEMTVIGNAKSGRDPRFVNAAALDYRLQTNSPAAAAGLGLSGAPFGITNDALGVARPQGGAWDLGAYETDGAGEGPLANAAYVRTNGNNSTGDGSSGNPWATINYALGQLAANGTLSVAAGTYAESVQIGPDKKFVTIRGGYDPVSWLWDPANRTTVIDGQGAPPVTLAPTADSNTLSYLTLKGGTNSAMAGIMFMGPGQHVLVDGCTIVSNAYGIYAPWHTVWNATVRNTVIARNASYGMYFEWSQAARTCAVYNCTVANNGGDGYLVTGAHEFAEVVPVAKNSLFTGNTGYGIRKTAAGSGASIASCLFYGNTSGATNCTGDTGIADLGNNLMTNPPLYSGAAPKYYQLQEESPALNSGENLLSLGVTVDIDGGIRPRGAAFDRGAYEMRFIRGTSFLFR